MTAAIAPESSLEPTYSLSYQVDCTQPQSHLLAVTLTILPQGQTSLDLKCPVWTPGSYLVREYARHIQDFQALQGDGTPLPWQKISKNHWQISLGAAPVEKPIEKPVEKVVVSYRVYAYELTVRTNHCDASHAYFNPAALCLYVPEYRDRPLQITIISPPGWQVTTPLTALPGQTAGFWAENYDTLVDSPFEMGCHHLYAFQVQGKPHELAVWGQGNLDPDRAIADIEKIIKIEAELFGGLPYDRYVFFLHLTAKSYGGLEHRNSCSLIFNRFGFRQPEQYQRFLCLVAHEFFHLWNVKRLRPKGLEIFDYDQENYTPCLWFCEGITSYYDQLIPLWANLFDAATYLKLLSESLNRYLKTPGRQVQSLADSSFDAWIKLYRPDANSPNAQMSYYLKGELVALLLDLRIRLAHNHQRSLNTVLQNLWHTYGIPEIGYSHDQLWAEIEAVAGEDLGDFRRRYVEETDELPLVETLGQVGLELVEDRAIPYTGIQLKQTHGAAILKTVFQDSPAQGAGLAPGDELVAIARWRITAEQWQEHLQNYQPGDHLEITFFRDGVLHTTTLVLGDPQPHKYVLRRHRQASSAEIDHLCAWLGPSARGLRSPE